jgi:hypothetical protein
VPDHAPINVCIINESARTPAERAKVISSWSSEGGVLIIGYEMYRKLTTAPRRRAGKVPAKGSVRHVCVCVWWGGGGGGA